MSRITKILSGLKKRRADASPGEPAVRAGQAPKNRAKKALIGGVVLGLVCMAGWLWWSRQKIAAPASVAQTPAKPISVPQAISPPIGATSGEEVSQVITASQPVAEAIHEAAPKEDAPDETAPKKIAHPLPSPLPSPLPHEAPLSNSLPQAGERTNVKSNLQFWGEEGKGSLRELHIKETKQETGNAVSSPEPGALPPSAVRAHATKSRRKHNKVASSPAPGKENMARDTESGGAPVPDGGVSKQVKPLSARQQADNEYRRANGLVEQGRTVDALAGYETALQLDAGHDAARQAMVVLLLETKRNADAERVLQDGLKYNIKNSGFAMLLARIQVERDALWSALLTLQKTLPYAERQADYQAFVAALLQRLNRHKEAVMHYQSAVQLSPNSGVWWMGLGISLQALQQNEEARAAFRHALESRTLNADLQAFVAQKLKEL